MAATANPRARLEHVLFHIQGVASTLQSVSFDNFAGVYHLERTVERAMQIISEAIKALPPELLTDYPEVEWERSWRSAIFCGTNTNGWILQRCGISRPSSCQSLKRSCRK